ncbi:unnamed protein product, partial [Acanthoscelides obtectus]
RKNICHWAICYPPRISTELHPNNSCSREYHNISTVFSKYTRIQCNKASQNETSKTSICHFHFCNPSVTCLKARDSFVCRYRRIYNCAGQQQCNIVSKKYIQPTSN